MFPNLYSWYCVNIDSPLFIIVLNLDMHNTLFCYNDVGMEDAITFSGFLLVSREVTHLLMCYRVLLL